MIEMQLKQISEIKIQAFDSFHLVFKILGWTGYFKLLKEPKSSWKRLSHKFYRLFSFFITFIFIIQHFIFMVQKDREVDEVFDSLIIEIPQLYLIGKIITLNLQASRIDKINNIIRGPFFAAKNRKDEDILLQNNKSLSYLFNALYFGITMVAIFWPANHFVRRYNDKNAIVPSYVPFNTDTWGKYSISVVLEVLPLLWIGYGHFALDNLISAYFAQTRVQLKIIKNHLLHLFNTKGHSAPYQYKDDVYPYLQTRLVCCIQRFEKLAWYTKEVNDIFNPALLFQFVISSLSICTVIYRLSTTPVASVPFIFMMAVLILVSNQTFIFCYFGTLVQYESESLACTLYLSDWLSVSPPFRRQLLIAMARWSVTFEPMVSGIIPLSLTTFITILRSAYSLYAILGARR